MNSIVIDSGPLIALFDSGDKYHYQSREFVINNRKPLISFIPVITEVICLLNFNVNAQLDFLEWVYRGGVGLIEISKDDIFDIKGLMEKYQDVPMDFADASIVAICDKLAVNSIATLDSDFEIYRYKKFKNTFNKGTKKG